MKNSSPSFHPSFTLNGSKFESTEELIRFAKDLEVEGYDFEVHIGKFIQKWLNEKTHLKVKTSGSTGKPKKIDLNKTYMINSAKATGAFLKLGENTSALLCLPAKYIAGKMMLVRAMTLGWNLHVVAPEKDALTQYDNEYDFVAMVPYQVMHSLSALSKVKKLIIGGAPVSKELEEKLRSISTEVFETYGMTETVSHIAMKRLNGKNKTDRFTALPGVTFTQDKRNCLVINAAGISEKTVTTNDLVDLYSPESFKWLGRIDNVINSGGVKVNPEIIEDKLTGAIDFPFLVASEKDEQLGERVILIIEQRDDKEIPNYSETFASLSTFERPKKIYTLSSFPYTETGKIKRNDVLRILEKYRF